MLSLSILVLGFASCTTFSSHPYPAYIVDPSPALLKRGMVAVVKPGFLPVLSGGLLNYIAANNSDQDHAVEIEASESILKSNISSLNEAGIDTVPVDQTLTQDQLMLIIKAGYSKQKNAIKAIGELAKAIALQNKAQYVLIEFLQCYIGEPLVIASHRIHGEAMVISADGEIVGFGYINTGWADFELIDPEKYKLLLVEAEMDSAKLMTAFYAPPLK